MMSGLQLNGDHNNEIDEVMLFRAMTMHGIAMNNFNLHILEISYVENSLPIKGIISLIIESEHKTCYSLFGSFESKDGEYTGNFHVYKLTKLIPNYEKAKDYCDEIGLKFILHSYPHTAPKPDLDMYAILIDCSIFYQARIKSRYPGIIRPFVPVFDKIVEVIEFKIPNLVNATYISVDNSVKYLRYRMARLGIKFYPMKRIAYKCPLPILNPWNELYCLQLCNEFLEKKMTNLSVQYYGNKEVEGSNVHIYQNMAIYNKFKLSQESVEKMNKLGTDIMTEIDSSLADANLRAVKIGAELSVLSDKSLMIFMQDHSAIPLYWVRKYFSMIGLREFQQLMFCVFHQLYLLSLNLVIHGDLHLGNVLFHCGTSDKLYINRYIVPKTDMKVFGGGTWRDFKYESIKIPCSLIRAEYPCGSNEFYVYNAFDSELLIVDFSRSVVFNPDALTGIYPFKSELRSIQLMQLWRSIRHLLMDYDSLIDEFTCISIMIDEPVATLKALEGIDFLMFAERLKEHVSKHSTFVTYLNDVISSINSVLKARLSLLNDRQFEVLLRLPNIYTALMERHCDMLLGDNGLKPIDDVEIIKQRNKFSKKEGEESTKLNPELYFSFKA